MRGQFLALIDLRSTYILGFVLISAAPDRPSTYNASQIRNLISTVHGCYGLPRRAFYLEGGAWRAKTLTGGALDGSHTEAGLREFGIRFVHARLPRAKPIERVFGALQNLSQAEPGYVGRGWHSDRYERVEKQQRLVEAGRVAPGEHFHSRDEWVERLTALVDQYNAEPQEGKYCAGLSPREAYEAHFGGEQLVRLPESARYLLANERKALRVGRNGISFVSRGERYTYKNVRTGELRNRTVEIFWSYESPEIAGVKHPESGEIFAVRRATLVDGFDAPPEQLAQAHAENAEHESYRRALYRAVRPKFSEHFMKRPIFAPTLVDAATTDAGRQYEESAAVEMQAMKRERKLNRRAVTVAGSIGMRLRPGARSEEQIAALDRLAALAGAEPQIEHGAADAANAEPCAVRQYALKAPALTPAQRQGIYFRLWGEVAKARPWLNRHTLTRKALGFVKPLKALSDAEFARVVAALKAALTEAAAQ